MCSPSWTFLVLQNHCRWWLQPWNQKTLAPWKKSLIFLESKGLSRVFFKHCSSKVLMLRCSVFFIIQLSHPYMTTGKTIALIIWIFVGKVMSLIFNMLSRFVIAFLPRSNHLLISWLQSPSVVILKTKKINFVTVFIVSPSIFHEVMGPDAMIFIFWMLSFKPAFSPSSFTFIKRLSVPLHSLP